jgi:hypothetical protein
MIYRKKLYQTRIYEEFNRALTKKQNDVQNNTLLMLLDYEELG